MKARERGTGGIVAQKLVGGFHFNVVVVLFDKAHERVGAGAERGVELAHERGAGAEKRGQRAEADECGEREQEAAREALADAGHGGAST